ncbi:MAG TPA: glycosyltransferase family 2 protein [Flavitalea sp.]|nr:glycosyltransferase family 2 protein [Flavitalea sp.]
MTDLTIVIPAYNEEKSLNEFLPEVIAHCEEKNYLLIVVNDGSKDKTLQVLKCFEQKTSVLKIVSHKLNRGYGGAIKSGVRAAITKFMITIDADGQHYLEDVDKLFHTIVEENADMVIGNRGLHASSYYRTAGKWLIRKIAKILMPLKVKDINSGIKIYNTELAKRYIKICPNTMAYSDVIGLFFVSQRHLVLETPVKIRARNSGKSTISTATAFDTLKEIINIVVLFNPMRIFFPLSLIFFLGGLAWGLPIIWLGRGLSVGAMLFLTTGILFFLLGLIAEQLSSVLKSQSISSE